MSEDACIQVNGKIWNVLPINAIAKLQLCSYFDTRSCIFMCRALPTVGTPWTSVGIEDILELRKLNYTWTKSASMLNIYRATLYRRLEEAGISADDQTPTHAGTAAG